MHGAVGGLSADGQPLICSSLSDRKCYLYTQNSWTETLKMNSIREFAAISSSPFPNSSLLISGGRNFPVPLNTLEVLRDENNWETIFPSMPTKTYGHCMVMMNTTSIIIIGGYQNNEIFLKDTYILNTEKDSWIKGPPLKQGRNHHSCGRIRNELLDAIIVVGGYSGLNQTLLSTVEILEKGASEWSNGPELPFGISGAQMVIGSNGKSQSLHI